MMAECKDRQPNQNLYGRSFEELLLQAQKHLAFLDDRMQYAIESERLRQCLEEMLWRQRRSIDDPDVQAEIAKVTAERAGICPWEILPIEILEAMLTWWRQSGREAPPRELAESHLHAMIHALWQEIKPDAKL